MVTVIKENEIYLGGERYTIKGKVEKRLLTQSPLKHWNINDQSGGMGCMELKESRDLNKCWFSTCNLDHRGHLIPQPLASSAINRYSTWTSPTGFTAGDWADEALAYDGNPANAATIVLAAGVWSVPLELTVAATSARAVRIKVATTAPAATDQIRVAIYYSADWHDVYTGVYRNAVYVTYDFGATRSITAIRIYLYSVGGCSGWVHECGILSSTADSDSITTCCWANFNNQTYLAVNTKLYELDSIAGNIYSSIKSDFAANITCLIPSVDNSLAILQGDSVAFWYMSTINVFTQTDETGAYYGVHWNNKFCWINSDGTQFSYCTAFAAILAETDNGVIGMKCSVKGLDVYQDAAGMAIVYARTNIGVFAHDSTGVKFYKTNLDLAQHSSTAKAGLNWNTGYYVSQGIHVKNYTTGQYNATTDPVGLDADDGLPDGYNAHIVSFIPDSTCFYALYDSTLINATSYSWVGKFNGRSWSCLWATGTVNGSMHSGIVSDVYSRRLWFDCGNSIYYIPLATTLLFPKLVSTSTYATAATHWTPWFEGDVSTLNRTATEIVSFCKSISTTEKIFIQYRLNRTYTDLGSDWTSVLSLDTTGENNRVSTTLASGAGLAFNAFQFRIVFTNSGAATATGDLQGLSLSYLDEVDSKYGFRVIIPLGEGASGNEPSDIDAKLKIAVETGTLLEFTYRNKADTTETYFVRVQPFSGRTATGDNFSGEYEVNLIEP